MEKRHHQFFGFIVILMIIGFLNYFRRVINGDSFTKYGKILYILTMITFIVGIMFVLYFNQNISNFTAFIIGLSVTILSEQIAKLFIIIGNNFNHIIVRIIKKTIGVDLSNDLLTDNYWEKYYQKHHKKHDKKHENKKSE